LTPVVLYQLATPALDIAGTPLWPGSGDENQSEMLVWRGSCDKEEPGWFLCPVDSDSCEAPPASEDDLPLAADLAATLISDHLRRYLLVRGWQVQAHVRRSEPTWRLVDCLSPVDGGGDRLDADYPSGPEELDVICRSVVAVHTDIRRR
jgi:hypothetical protein